MQPHTLHGASSSEDSQGSHSSSPERPGDRPERRRWHRPQRVLVVDDMVAVRQVWASALRMWGFAVEEAANGLEAVERARTHPPDLVLMDISMPVMDGIRATAALRAEPATASIPVVAVSGSVSEQVAEAAIAAGADVVLAKPLSLRELIDQIRILFARISATATAQDKDV